MSAKTGTMFDIKKKRKGAESEAVAPFRFIMTQMMIPSQDS